MSVEKDIVYKKSPTPNFHSLDLYLPQQENGGALPPLLIYIHGGLWVDRDKKEYTNIGEFYAKKGYAVAVLNYRLTQGPAVVHPAHTQDAAEALLFLSEHGHKYRYDATKIFLVGHSCGAHMIGLILLNRKKYLPGKNNIGVRGVISLQGLFDQELFLQDFPRFTKDIEDVFTTDKSNWEAPQFLKNEESAMNCAPWLLIHSNSDSWVERTQSSRFCKHLKELGCSDVQCTGESMKGNHFDVVLQIGTKDDEVSTQILEFVRTHSS